MTGYQSACRWFLTESRFQQWRMGSCSDILYVTARAGCGKTTLAAHVINALQRNFHLEGSQDRHQEEHKLGKTMLLYFFFQKVNVDDEGTAVAALRGIISQLVYQMPALHELLRRQYDILALKEHVSWSWEPLLAVFLSMIRQIREQTHSIVTIVLDGVDECSSNSRGGLLAFLVSVVEDHNNSVMGQPRSLLKVLITGRPDEEMFLIIPEAKHLEITDSHTTNDIDTLIETGVKQLGDRRHLAPEVQLAIRNFLHSKAKGMFLWVVLVLEELDRRDQRLTDDSIATRLRNVPLTLSLVYEKIIDDVPQSRREDMWRILLFMLTSFRPLSLIELKAALCIHIGIPEWHDFIGDVKQLCGSLVRITHGRVRFVHQSAQDFLETYAYRTSVEQLSGSLWDLEQAEVQITKVCLKYLLQDGLFANVYNARPRGHHEDWMRGVLEKWPFLRYAAEHWALHLRAAASPDLEVIKMAFELLDDERHRDMLMKLTYYFTHHGTPTPPKKGTQLHVAAYFNLSWFIAEYIHKGVGLDDVADCRDTALVWGSEMGSTESIKLLLQAGADPKMLEYDGWSPLHWAATNGHVEICKLLLEHGANADVLDDRGTTPYDWAVARNHRGAAAEIENFGVKEKTSKGRGGRQNDQGLAEGSSPMIKNQWLGNGRLARNPHTTQG